ncbi:pseudouridine synthase [Maritalea sp.]|uniref:pseudouridine synthase n=1 Tax=Maritalea sp. TaxID=2003361 RepID=UPI003EF65DDF
MATDKKNAPEKSRDGERIAKVIARSGYCSRRMAETWVEEGRISVNGKIVKTPAYNVTEKDRISIDGNPLAKKEPTRMWAYYKPVGLVVSESDPDGRPTVFEEFDKADMPRVLTIGRLDINTEGLLLLTNEGGLKRVLELPSTGWTRRYRVRAHGRISQEKLDELKDGITVDKVHYGPIEAKLERQQGANAWIIVSLKEGKNREVKNVLAALGLDVNRLIRMSYGPFQLNEMKEGEIQSIKARVIKDQLSAKLIKDAGVDFDEPSVPVENKRPPKKGEKPVRGKPHGRVDRPVRPVRKKYENKWPEEETPKSKVFFDDGRTKIIDTPVPRKEGDDDRRGGRREDRPFVNRDDRGGSRDSKFSRGKDDDRGSRKPRVEPEGRSRPDARGGNADRSARPPSKNKSFEERGGRPQSAKSRGPRRDDRTASDRRGAFVNREDGSARVGAPTVRSGTTSDRPDSRGRSGKNKTFVSATRDDGRGYGKSRAGGKPTGGKPGGSKPTGGRPTGARPTGGRPTGGKPTGGKPAGRRPGNANANSNPNRRGAPPKTRK